MTFEFLDKIVEQAYGLTPPSWLLARQIHSSSTPNPYYNFLALLAAHFAPGFMLEIGCEKGCVAAHVTSVNGCHVGIDIKEIPFSHPKSIMIHGDSVGVEDFGRPTVEIIESITNKCGLFYAVFQDSSHHYAESKKEWELYSKFVSQGGIWICDDITPAFKTPQEDKGMVDYFAELPGEKKLYPGLHIGNAIGIVLL